MALRSQILSARTSCLRLCHIRTIAVRAPGCQPQQQKLRLRKALGFSFGEPDPENDDGSYADRRGPSRKPTKLSVLSALSASLLVFQNVLRGPVGEAFLAVLAVVSKFQASNREVLAAYGNFYAALLISGFENWESYLLDQILLARENAFARAVAQGDVGANAPVLRAVEHDLQVLQALCLPLSRLAESVGEAAAAPLAGSDWVEAASSVSLKAPTSKQLVTNSTGGVTALNVNMPARFIQRPPTPDELQQWRSTIASRDSWSEAVSVLQQYYHLHGFGVTSRSSTLRWVDGALEHAPQGMAPASVVPLSVLKEPRSILAANTLRHVEGQPGAQHVLLIGHSGSGKTTLLWESTLAAGKDLGLRLVELHGTDIRSVLQAARGCARYPRVRFIIAADNINFPVGESLAAGELASGLSGTGPSGWPTNTLLYMVASSSSTISYSNELVQRFGLVLTTSNVRDLPKERFVETVKEFMAHSRSTTTGAVQLVDEDAMVETARQKGGLTVWSAAWLAQERGHPGGQ